MMKLFYVLIWCACLAQICAGSDETINKQKKLIRDRIYAVSEQFVDDLVNITENYRNNSFIYVIFDNTFQMLKQLTWNERNSKIDVNHVKDFSSKNPSYTTVVKAIYIDYLRISQIILSKQLQSERYNGLVNLLFVCILDYATTEEIQSALNYLYGVDIEATKTSFLDSHNLPKVTNEDDCPRLFRFSPVIDVIRRLIDVKPKVLQDFLAIREQFPCNRLGLRSLSQFFYVIQLGGAVQKINACVIKEGTKYWSVHSKDYMEHELETLESVLSTRLPDETFRDIINFERSTTHETPIDEIEKALEYLYEDVPKTECPTTCKENEMILE